MRMRRRLRDLEQQLGPELGRCPACNGPRIIMEEHFDGVVRYVGGVVPCEVCDSRDPSGAITRIIVHGPRACTICDE